MFNKRNKKRGFTLIELIIVIAIIAILAAIAVPAFGKIRTKANVSADLGNARTIYSLVTTEIASDNIAIPTTGVYTTTLDQIAGNTNGNTVDIESQIEPKPVVKTYQNYKYYVSIDSNGNVQVSVGANDQSKQVKGFGVYPNATGKYAGTDTNTPGELPNPGTTSNNTGGQNQGGQNQGGENQGGENQGGENQS